MEKQTTAPMGSSAALWIGRVMSLIVIAIMGLGGVAMLIDPQPMVKMLTDLGYQAGMARGIAAVEVVCVLIYCYPRTAVLGAILLTGYLGGATASHVRAGQPFWLPLIVGLFVWLGLYLRIPELRRLVPFRR